ncbi:hypothetical protein [Gordonia sp. CNJ-863]|uniref:hypothetical protein n=1 Tax=Gordonia sp. CNJ-863 TaxID=1904963 RepID=UPI00096A417A|nr:hypothetical protein [Gordonia sp. CNJ-863]
MADIGTIEARWVELSAAVDRLTERIGDPDDFPVHAGSSLAGDDRASHPFEVSQALRHIINVSVDQLHGVKTAVREGRYLHLGVSSTLARAALENAVTGLWILGPRTRNTRIERVLRWNSRNYHDSANYLRDSAMFDNDRAQKHDQNLAQIAQLATARGIDPDVATNGFPTTKPIKQGAQYTDLPVYTDWQIASGFAHGRPWAHHGFLERRRVSDSASEHRVYTLSAREDVTIYLPMQAMHLLSELVRLRDRRAGVEMPPRPDGEPDYERANPT